jgi:hypothetical protein
MTGNALVERKVLGFLPKAAMPPAALPPSCATKRGIKGSAIEPEIVAANVLAFLRGIRPLGN